MTKETTALEAEMEATRERLAGTIDQLVHRASPKTIARREITSIKGYFVDLRTGQPRTDNILKVAGGVVGVVVLVRASSARSPPTDAATAVADKLPIKMLHDRLLVEVDQESGERRSSGGIVIPATAAMGARRLVWSRVVAVGPARPRRRRSTTGCCSTPRTRPRSRCRARRTS